MKLSGKLQSKNNVSKSTASKFIIVSVLFGILSAQAAFADNTPAKPVHSAQEVLGKIPGMQFRKNLPDNFPVPKYTSNVTKTSFINSTKGLANAAASIITKDEAKKVFDWYQDACKSAGWVIKVPTDKAMAATGQQGKLFMLEGMKPNQHVFLNCVAQRKLPGTIINITWTKTLH